MYGFLFFPTPGDLNSSEDFLSFSAALHIHHTIMMSFHSPGLSTIENKILFSAQWKHLASKYMQKLHQFLPVTSNSIHNVSFTLIVLPKYKNLFTTSKNL